MFLSGLQLSVGQKEVDMCADDSETEDLFQFVGVRIVPKT